VPTVVSRDDVERLVRARGAQLVEVLPRSSYDAEHIAGARSLPLAELGGRAPAELDARRPVITYCHDSL
jgi:rhodanese-related sulfurtransferase